jgi:hypothetical protein
MCHRFRLKYLIEILDVLLWIMGERVCLVS